MPDTEPASQKDIDDVIDSYESRIKETRDELMGEIQDLHHRIDTLEREMDK